MATAIYRDACAGFICTIVVPVFFSRLRYDSIEGKEIAEKFSSFGPHCEEEVGFCVCTLTIARAISYGTWMEEKRTGSIHSRPLRSILREHRAGRSVKSPGHFWPQRSHNSATASKMFSQTGITNCDKSRGFCHEACCRSLLSQGGRSCAASRGEPPAEIACRTELERNCGCEQSVNAS